MCVDEEVKEGVEVGEKLEWSLVVGVDEKEVGVNGVSCSNFWQNRDHL